MSYLMRISWYPKLTSRVAKNLIFTEISRVLKIYFTHATVLSSITFFYNVYDN